MTNHIPEPSKAEAAKLWARMVAHYRPRLEAEPIWVETEIRTGDPVEAIMAACRSSDEAPDPPVPREPIPEFLTRTPITAPRFRPWWRRWPSVLLRLWPKLSPPLRSWRTGRYLIIELEDDTP